MEEKTLVRGKFYFFGSRGHDDDIYFGRPGKNRVHTWSRITPAEGAHMLGVPNMILVSSDGQPVPFSHESYNLIKLKIADLDNSKSLNRH